jgi:hypothetical protein
MQFHSHDHQLICLCEIQKCHAARERLIGFLQIIEVGLNSTVPLFKRETIRDSLSLHYNFKPDMCTYQSMEINTAFDHETPQSRDVRAAAETCGRCDGARNHHA